MSQLFWGFLLLVALSACGSVPASLKPAVGPGQTTPTTTVMVRGVVTVGPLCPVVPVSIPNRCADQPIAATIAVVTGAATVARTESSPDGRFQVALPPGQYTLRATAPRALFCRPVPLEVPSPQATDVMVRCDTGIR
jgi:hypothetical protein